MPVNDQVTDSVTQVNTKVLGDVPAMAGGNLLMSTSQALSTAALNVTSANQQAGLVMQAATVQGINSIMATGTAVIGRGAEAILQKG
ncbi:RebB family R body protein [Photobacterium chitinilyticum]|uniref:Glycerol-3-phosphate dehydrogenase subunit C n=1 Tax=Photobacterium chitinilyticum TaxID=2485123 RepID=A0A3S3S360_9GAMM|nr:RebB family R body protein [Photobacterium chitinilyticum]RWX57066.1 glycerol-3-phosphate dehydrogenase subunit C [Photobacterium chitinilyticum]